MKSCVAVIDYGMGNLHSVAKAFEHVSDDKHEIVVTANPDIINNADRIVFPGVGAIRDCMAEIKRLNIDTLVKKAISEKPVFAVCVGMQALFDRSEENNGVDCIGIFPGVVKYFGSDLKDIQGARLKVPHMGWNTVKQIKNSHPVWKGIHDNSYFYFVHSYRAEITAANEQYVAGTCEYGQTFAAAMSKTNVFATQFHPEKSHNDGLQLYKNFLNWNGAL
jgi:imidazole glycerol-phosphate synthase subunit HisH